MVLRERAISPEDIPECVEILRSHPVVGPRYGKAIEDLPAALRLLLDSDAQTTSVMFSGEGTTAPICWIGISVFVTDDFLEDLKKPPHFWIGAELTRRIVRGKSPLLAGKELRQANSQGGLNLLCWEGTTRCGSELNGEWLRFMMSTFIEKSSPRSPKVWITFFWRSTRAHASGIRLLPPIPPLGGKRLQMFCIDRTCLG
jgi:hypothetical protein